MWPQIPALKGQDLHRSLEPLLSRLYEYLQFGGYPEVALQRDSGEKVEVLRSIFDLFVKKDLVEYLNIRKIRELKEMIVYLAINNGQKIKYENIATLTSFSIKTVRNYLELLTEVFLIHVIRPFFTNKTKELVKIPKVYFLDPGVLISLSTILAIPDIVLTGGNCLRPLSWGRYSRRVWKERK